MRRLAAMLAASAALVAVSGGAAVARQVVMPARYALPDPRINPGAIDPRVTQANIHRTICVRGYTRRVRPPVDYTERVKRRQIAAYHYADRRLRDYELDHLVSLELGGAPADPHNLWPEPHHVVGGWGSRAKDALENRLHALVCRGRLSLAEAQRMIATDWIGAYRRLFGATPRR